MVPLIIEYIYLDHAPPLESVPSIQNHWTLSLELATSVYIHSSTSEMSQFFNKYFQTTGASK